MTKNQSISISNINFETFIGPWVLPNEEIPVHITWDKDFDFDFIITKVPRDLDFVEAINILDYEIQETNIKILKDNIKKLGSDHIFPNFIGLIFVFRDNNFNGLKIFKDIEIIYYKNQDMLKNISLIAKIFRPRLKDISSIPTITLTDDRKLYSIDVNLECEGFGFVSAYLETQINEIKIPYDFSIFKKACENLEKRYDFVFNNNENIEKEPFYEGIDEDSIEKFIKFLSKCSINPNFKPDDILNTFKEDNFENVFIADFFTELLKETRLRYEYENVELKNPTTEIPYEKFNEIIHSSKIYIHYEDLIKNKYNPIEIIHKVKDRRSDTKDTKITFLININKIKDNTFEDIEKIKRD